MHKEILKELGLTSNEVEVYLALLKSGSISVNDIAKNSGLHRQAVYDASDRLLEKGFVSFVIKNNKKYFQGVNPEKILDYLKEKEERFMAILPELSKLTKFSGEDTFVEVFKGKGIVRIVYTDIIKEFTYIINKLQKKVYKRGYIRSQVGEVLISGVDETKFIEEDKIALQQHLKKLQRLKCKERILIKEGDTNFVEGPQTEYRWISAESFNPTPIYAYNNKLTIIIWGNPNYAIIIKNKNLADAYRKQFNLLWRGAKRIRM